jgi:hypothetical protein
VSWYLTGVGLSLLTGILLVLAIPVEKLNKSFPIYFCLSILLAVIPVINLLTPLITIFIVIILRLKR